MPARKYPKPTSFSKDRGPRSFYLHKPMSSEIEEIIDAGEEVELETLCSYLRREQRPISQKIRNYVVKLLTAPKKRGKPKERVTIDQQRILQMLVDLVRREYLHRKRAGEHLPLDAAIEYVHEQFGQGWGFSEAGLLRLWRRRKHKYGDLLP